MPVRPVRLPAFLLAFLFTVFAMASPARADEGQVETAWRMLDYMAVDYPGAVQNGRVVNQTEYDEQVEFSGSVVARIAALPARPQRAALVAEARQFQAAIVRKAGGDEVLLRARALGDHLLAAYPVRLAPETPPDLNRGAALYAENCASCHGADGHADTPAAHALDPAPIAFADRDRARERSLFAYYQVISQGIEGTAMQSWSQLSSQDRWALAFYVARFSYPDSLGKQGEAQWAGDPRLRRRIPDLKTLVGLTPAQLASEIGAQRAEAVFAFLRSDPDVFDQNRGVSSLAVSRALLRQAVEAYRAGVPENGKPFPDGSKIAKIHWKPEKSAEAPGPTTVPGALQNVDFIEKDSKRFADSGGWGYAAFEYDTATDTFRPANTSAAPPQENDAKCGFACHTIVQAKDYIFTAYPRR